MEITKLIKTLRHCGSHKGCYTCPSKGSATGDCMKMLLDAADELEAAQNLIGAKEPTSQQMLQITAPSVK